MKKFSRILCIILSVIMAAAFIVTAVACGPTEKREEVSVIIYKNGDTQIASYTVDRDKKIPENKIPSDPVPESDKKFAFWSDTQNGTTDFIANSKPTKKEVTLYAVFHNRQAGEIVVTFDSDGGNRVPSVVLSGAGKVSKPSSNPTLSGATFRYWKSDKQLGEFNFDTTITEDTVIKAVWNEGKDKTLVVSSNDWDKVFTPFFSSSGDDANVHSQTQVAMLSSDAEGNVYVGEDVPSVVKSYRFNTWVNGEIDNSGTQNVSAIKDNPDLYHTDYEFVIKNGIKLPDGKSEITIEDVLFNMYVYLDPVYTGSNTMYSTNIIGLNSYRNQEEGATNDNDSTAITMASERVYSDIAEYYDNDPPTRERFRNGLSTDERNKLLDDVQRMRVHFWEGLQSDWQALENLGKEELAKTYIDYGFTEVWQAFLLSYDMLTVKYTNEGAVDKHYNNEAEGYVNGIQWNGRDTWHRDQDNLTKIIFNNYAGAYTGAEQGNIYKDQSGDVKIDLIINQETRKVDKDTNGDWKNELDTATLRNKISSSPFLLLNKLRLLYRWQCGTELYNHVLAEIKTELYDAMKRPDGTLAVETVSGITVTTLPANTEFYPQDSKKPVVYSEDHYVLNISILGVDPKALWNFGFTVAPMSYYSNPDGKQSGYTSAAGYESFCYPGVYNEALGRVATASDKIHLGFSRFDANYINKVMKHERVLGLPYGAGPFIATDSNWRTSFDQVKPTTFCNGGMVYFRRNEQFETTGTAMNNVKFEFMQYKVVESSRVIDSLVQEEVDLGDPNAKQENVNQAERTSHLTPKLIQNNGYGYVGINAKHVPDLEIRQAIMYALNTDLIKSYYVGELAEILHRPMSTTNWAYPTGVEQRYPFSNDAAIENKIKDLVAQAGTDSKYGDAPMQNKALARVHENGLTVDLSFVFSVAGSTTDHPAYQMFESAAKLLNKCGFNVTVRNDPQALIKLSSGLLEVWAAAWQTTIDPDMYQLYHYKSQAQATTNWGYPYLYDQGQGTAAEIKIIKDLADLIEKGRSTLNQTSRKAFYKDALDKVMDLAVEYPIYQRQNLTVYNNTKIDANSLNQNPTVYSGLINFIWTVRML